MQQTVQVSLRDRLLAALQVEATEDQMHAIDLLADFFQGNSGVFLLKGYAGTGKTTLISALTRVFSSFVLLAPTGRAAKVLSGYSGFPASTIHRHIYHVAAGEAGRFRLKLAANRKRNTLFIVDECSMIGNNASEENPENNLLDDLLMFVAEGKNCKMILAGDTAQLPPVHADFSPALDADNVSSIESGVYHTELKKVVRQAEAGGILLNATALRILIARNAGLPVLKTTGFNDIFRISGMDLKDELENAYSDFGYDEVLVITRSNKAANQYNQLIRRQILWLEEELSAGDRLMVVKNNYFWLDKDSPAGFIANGDTAEVLKVIRTEEKYGLRYARVSLRLVDYPSEPAVEALVLMDTLYAEGPALGRDGFNKVFEAACTEHKASTKTKKRELLRSNEYLNALQVKFAYAVTCHKAQGGQWKTVFVDEGYVTDEMQTASRLRWLYTAFTRATDRLYLINFPDAYFSRG